MSLQTPTLRMDIDSSATIMQSNLLENNAFVQKLSLVPFNQFPIWDPPETKGQKKHNGIVPEACRKKIDTRNTYNFRARQS